MNDDTTLPPARTSQEVPLFRIAVTDRKPRPGQPGWRFYESGRVWPTHEAAQNFIDGLDIALYDMARVVSGPPFTLPSASPAGAGSELANETAAILSCPATMAALAKSAQDIAAERFISWDQVKRDLQMADDTPCPAPADEPPYDPDASARQEAQAWSELGSKIVGAENEAPPRSTPAALDEDVRVCGLASNGKWVVIVAADRHAPAFHLRNYPEDGSPSFAIESGDDLEFCAHARTRFPQVVRELQEALRENETLKAREVGHVQQMQLQLKEIAELRIKLQQHIDKATGTYWAWQGDDTDHLESLTCPVLIPANDLRELEDATRYKLQHDFLLEQCQSHRSEFMLSIPEWDEMSDTEQVRWAVRVMAEQLQTSRTELARLTAELERLRTDLGDEQRNHRTTCDSIRGERHAWFCMIQLAGQECNCGMQLSTEKAGRTKAEERCGELEAREAKFRRLVELEIDAACRESYIGIIPCEPGDREELDALRKELLLP